MLFSKLVEFIKAQTIRFNILLLLFSVFAAKSLFIFPFKLISGVLGAFIGALLVTLLFFVLAGAVFFLRKIAWEYRETKVKWYRLLLYMLPALLLYGFLLLVVFPGIVPYDSLYIWEMTITNKFTNLHPIAYTLYVDALNSIINSPWFLIAVQIVYTAFAFSMIACTFESMGLKRTWCWIITLLLTLYPANAMTTVTMLKDVNYIISLVLMSVLILRMVNRGKPTWATFIPLFAISLFALFSRHNALLTVTVCYIILALFYILLKKKGAAVKAAALGVAVLTAYFSVNQVIEAVLGESYWKRSGVLDIAMMPSAQLTFAIDQNWYELSDARKAEAEKYVDLGYIAETVKTRPTWKFSHIYIFTLKYHEIKDDLPGFARFYLGFWRDYAPDMILAYQQMTGIAWAVPNYGYTLLWNTGITPYPTDMGIHPQSVFPRMEAFLYREPSVYFWLRPALWLLLSILLFFAFSKRHGFAMIAVSSPMLANALGYFFGTPAQNVRYLYCNFIVFIILAVFCFMKREEAQA